MVEEEKEEESKEGEEEDDKEAKKPKVEKKKKEPEFGVWVGNLSYSTTVETIRNFFTDCGSITRVKCPKGNGVKNKNKG